VQRKEITEVRTENSWLWCLYTTRQQGNAVAVHCIKEGKDLRTVVEKSWKSSAGLNCSPQNMVARATMAAYKHICRVQAGSAASRAEKRLLCIFTAFYLLFGYSTAEWYNHLPMDNR